MPSTFSELRDRIHNKAEAYFTFSYERLDRADGRLLYGATDALLDAGMAASAFPDAITSNTATNLLACYGFLQAIYIQQDAVRVLSQAVGLSWSPDKDPLLSKIRDLRNRVTGHPALAGNRPKSQRRSSAIIPYNSIRASGFDGHIYYDDSTETMHVEVASVLRDNEERLAAQMEAIEKEMDRRERDFRSVHANSQFSDKLGTGFDYLVQRLYCDLNDDDRLTQASAHLDMIREKILALKADLDSRSFVPDVAANVETILEGLNLIGDILKGDRSAASQRKFVLIYGGLQKELESFTSSISALDSRLRSPVG